MKGSTHSYSWLLKIAIIFMGVAGFILLSITPTTAITEEFVTTWRTDIEDPADLSITIPTYSTATYDYTVDWGDSTVQTNITGDATHTYSVAGTYTIKISGTFPRLYFNNYADRHKIISVDAWGDNQWSSMTDAFEGATNLRINATDAPDLSLADSLSGMFAGATALNDPIGHWDVSTIKNFSYMFYGAQNFNQDISSWNTASAQTFLSVFDTAKAFNQPIGNWNTGNVTSLNSMFMNAEAFNQPINNWDTDDVTDTRYMFENAKAFNQPLTNWELPLVTRTDNMFKGATLFDQNMSAMRISQLQRASNMFTGSALSPANYDALLLSWGAQPALNQVIFHADTTTYCNGGAARATLTTNNQWTFYDAGEDLSTCGPTDIYFEGSAAPTLVEKQLANAPIGSLSSVDSDETQNHSYDLLCTNSYPDSSFFAISGNVLSATISFDHAFPQDADADNVYEICIVSQDPSGFKIEKEFSITVLAAPVIEDEDEETPVDEEPIDEEEDQEEDTDNGGVIVEGGEVLGANTNNGNQTPPPAAPPTVLGTSTGSVLASTGENYVTAIAAGIVITAAVTFTSSKKFRHQLYKLRR